MGRGATRGARARAYRPVRAAAREAVGDRASAFRAGTVATSGSRRTCRASGARGCDSSAVLARAASGLASRRSSQHDAERRVDADGRTRAHGCGSSSRRSASSPAGSIRRLLRRRPGRPHTCCGTSSSRSVSPDLRLETLPAQGGEHTSSTRSPRGWEADVPSRLAAALPEEIRELSDGARVVRHPRDDPARRLPRRPDPTSGRPRLSAARLGRRVRLAPVLHPGRSRSTVSLAWGVDDVELPSGADRALP